MDVAHRIIYFKNSYLENNIEIIGFELTRKEGGDVEIRRILWDGSISDRWRCDTSEDSALRVMQMIEIEFKRGKIGRVLDRDKVIKIVNKDNGKIIETPKVKAESSSEICGVCGKAPHDCVVEIKEEEEGEEREGEDVITVELIEEPVGEIEALEDKVDKFIKSVESIGLVEYLGTKIGYSSAASALVTMSFGSAEITLGAISSGISSFAKKFMWILTLSVVFF